MIARVARAALGLGLITSLASGFLTARNGAEPVRITSETEPSELRDVLGRDATVGLAYADSTPPSFETAVLMAGAAGRGAPVTLVVPGETPVLQVEPPSNPVAGRRTALRVALRGTSGDEVTVTVDAESGTSDTVTVQIGPEGVTQAVIGLEPARSGAAAWTVRALGSQVAVHAWVRPESAVRVLVLTGAPGWESRYLVRALEGAGAHVAVHQDLGRERTVATVDGFIPRDLADLADIDVVAVVGPTESASGDLLTRWISERGGGLLLVGAGAGTDSLTPWSARGASRPVVAESIRWAGPAEIVPLPSLDIQALATPIEGLGVPVAFDGQNGGAAVYATADWLGRGRVFASGIESWPWAVEAGLGAEHRRYWESVVEWLAGGLTSDLALTAAPGRPSVAWEGRLEGVVPPTLDLTAPDGAEEQSLSTLPGSALDRHVRFVPVHLGAHGLATTLGPGPGTDLGTDLGMTVAEASSLMTWPEAALEVGGSGGTIRTATTDPAAAGLSPLRPSTRGRWLAFLLLACLAVTAWAHRRIHGLP